MLLKTTEEVSTFVSKLRIYAISDQDNTGAWIRLNFPHLRYIASIHAWNMYGLATWTGISGELLDGFDKGGPDSSLVSKEWLAEHIQIGPLGAAYPTPMFIMEGDTPATLFVLQNGLNSPENPTWGGWGGRYAHSDVSAGVNHYGDAADNVTGANGQPYKSNHATIWRWREGYQNDFAGRMQWTLSNRYEDANHAPVVGPVAQHGSFDDVIYITVGGNGGGNGGNGGNNGGNGGNKGGNGGNKGGKNRKLVRRFVSREGKARL